MKKILLYTGFTLLFLIFLGLVLLPGIGKKYIIKHSPEIVGRSLDIHKLKVSYLAGRVRITDFRLFEANHRDEFISFDTLMVDIRPLRLLKNELVLQEFYLSGLKTLVIQEDSLFNFTDLVNFHTQNTEEKELEEDRVAKKPFKYDLHDIGIQNSSLSFENRNVGDTMQIRDLSFFIPYLGWNQQEKSDAMVRFSLEKDGYMEAGVQIHPVNGEFDLSLQIRNLYLDGLRNYAADFARIDELKGVFNTQLDITGNYNQPEQSLISGVLEISDIYLSDEKERQVLGAGSIRTRIAELDPYHSVFRIDSLKVSSPYIFFELKDSSNNFYEILGHVPVDSVSEESPEPSPGTSVPDSSERIYYTIQSFIIEEGQIDFTDLTRGEEFTYALSDLEVNSEDIESTADRVNLYASMLLNRRGKLLAETTFSPLNPHNIVLDYTISDFQLSDLHIYSTFYTGFPILFGEMYYKGHTEIWNHELNSENKLILDQVTLGEKRGGITDLPIKFALFILKDRNGVIDLDIPVTGNTEDPQVNVGTIVWNTLKNLIVKTAAAPYDALASMIGVDPRDIESIEYACLDTMLTDTREKQLDMLLELEQIKDGLEIELHYFNDLDQEKYQIARELSGMSPSDSLDMDLLTGLMGEIDSTMNLFEQVRLSQVEGYLFNKNDSTEIQVIRSDLRAPQNVGSRPRFEVQYSAKEAELAEAD